MSASTKVCMGGSSLKSRLFSAIIPIMVLSWIYSSPPPLSSVSAQDENFSGGKKETHKTLPQLNV